MSGPPFRTSPDEAYGGAMAPVPNLPKEPDDNVETYVGLEQQRAEDRARERGWNTVRSLPPGAIITMEYQAGRLNFEVREGTVYRSWKG